MMQNLIMIAQMAKYKLNKFFSEEKGAVDMIAIVVLIGIVVLLALVFKDSIGGLLKSLFGTIEENAVDAVNTSVGGE